VLRVQKKRVELDDVIRYVNGLNLEDTANMLKEHKLDLVKKVAKDIENVVEVVEAVAAV
jgi:transcription initiation factor IIE alpha subunit